MEITKEQLSAIEQDIRLLWKKVEEIEEANTKLSSRIIELEVFAQSEVTEIGEKADSAFHRTKVLFAKHFDLMEKLGLRRPRMILRAAEIEDQASLDKFIDSLSDRIATKIQETKPRKRRTRTKQ